MSDEEETTAQLLRLAGAPADVPAERTARVREHVRRQWHAARHRRALQRRAAATTALLAAAAALILIVRVSAPREVASLPPLQVLATAERIQGMPLVSRVREGRRDVEPLSVSISMHADEVIETDGASRAALRAADGSALRVDRKSRLRLVAPGTIELIQGAVYIITAAISRGFEVRTSMGTVRDVGTQFEVRLGEASLRLRVRKGAVEIHRGALVTSAAAGTEATIASSGLVTRPVPTFGSDWEWTVSLAPSFAIEGRPLHAFLEDVTSEEGWVLRYADPALAEAAASSILHGSVEGLRAEEVLKVALATSGGLQYRLRDGELLISRPAETR